MSNLDVAVATFWQLARHWRKGDKAKLELACEGENLHIQLSAVLGHPDHLHFPDPPRPSSSVKKKSPSQLRRQERRRQEALLMADRATNTAEDIPDKVVSSKDAVMLKANSEKTKVKPSEKEESVAIPANEEHFRCSQCDLVFKTDKVLEIHIVKSHKSILQQTPEKERSNFTIEEPSLILTPINMIRDKEDLNKTLEKAEESEANCEVKTVDSVNKLCPICPIDDGYCHCGSCDECDYSSTEKGMNIHIMNQHMPNEVYEHFGKDWIRTHEHYIQGSIDKKKLWWKGYL
jgi:uncharacterized C2H2 Zn-finger protein